MKIWLIGNGILAKAFFSFFKKKNIDFVMTTKEHVNICRKKEIEEFFQNMPFTHVINCAAYTNVDEAEKNKELCFEVNATGVENLSLITSKKNAKLISFSTDYVFFGDSQKPYKEEDLKNPLNVYGKSKEKAEELLFKYAKDFLLIRTSWLFGDGKNFIKTMLNAMREKEEIKVVCDQIGRPTYADDAAENTYLLLSKKGVYHFANDTALSWYEYALKIFELAKNFGFKLKCKTITPVLSSDFKTLAQRPLYSVLDTKKVEDLLKKPTPSFEKALNSYFEKLCKEM